MTTIAPPPTPPPPLPPPPAAPPALERPTSPTRHPAPPADPRPTKRRRARWFARAMALAIIGVGLVMQPTGWMAIVFLFVLVVPFEKLFPRHRGQKVRRPGLSTDLAFALATPALEVVGATVAVVVGLASLAWLPGLALRPLVAMLPPAILPFVGIALFDLLIYWVHRWSHEVPLLWRFHAIHHSTETLDWVSGLRNHPFDGALLAPAFAFLLAAGFSAEFSGALVAVQIVTGIFLHANVRWKWRPLQRLVITPEFHHWHHANEPEAINTNFSVFLPLWDQIFGTYRVPKDRRPTVYGVDEYVPEGLWAQLRHPFRGMRPIRSYLRHPIRTIEELWAMTRTIVRGMRSSMFAKRRTSSRLNDRAAVPTLE